MWVLFAFASAFFAASVLFSLPSRTTTLYLEPPMLISNLIPRFELSTSSGTSNK